MLEKWLKNPVDANTCWFCQNGFPIYLYLLDISPFFWFFGDISSFWRYVQENVERYIRNQDISPNLVWKYIFPTKKLYRQTEIYHHFFDFICENISLYLKRYIFFPHFSDYFQFWRYVLDFQDIFKIRYIFLYNFQRKDMFFRDISRKRYISPWGSIYSHDFQRYIFVGKKIYLLARKVYLQCYVRLAQFLRQCTFFQIHL